MKVEVTIVLDIPEEYADDGLPKKDPLTPSGTPWRESFLRQAIFDQFINFSIVGHLEKVLEFMARKVPKGTRKGLNEQIVEMHREWADIIRKGQQNFKIKVLE